MYTLAPLTLSNDSEVQAALSHKLREVLCYFQVSERLILTRWPLEELRPLLADEPYRVLVRAKKA